MMIIMALGNCDEDDDNDKMFVWYSDDACSERYNVSSATDVLRHVRQLPTTGSGQTAVCCVFEMYRVNVKK